MTDDVHDGLLKPIIDAAEFGEAQYATWLFDMARGHARLCPPDALEGCPKKSRVVRSADAAKWAELAALGGNMGAAEFLCEKYRFGNARFGMQRDDDKAAKWCQIAAPQTCAIEAKVDLAGLYREGKIPGASREIASYWERMAIRALDFRTKNISIIEDDLNQRK